MSAVKENTYRPTFMAEAVWPQAGVLRDVVLILAGSWLIALTAQIEVPMWPVPMTGQTFAILLIGALLGKQRGVASVLAYLAQGAMGLPVFAGGMAGIGRLLGPTGGYLFGFVVVVYLVGWLSERGWDRRLATAALAMLVGNVVLYAFGLTWLATFVGWNAAVKAGLFPFIVGDLAKIALAAWALPAAWALLEK